MNLDDVSPSRIWSVGVMGSCRVYTPLKLAAQADKLKVAWVSKYGFRHNPLELRQGLDILRGRLKPPAALGALLNLVDTESFGETDLFRLRFSNIEAMVVEVSSIRIIEYDGWQLQLNRVREALLAKGVKEAEISNLFQASSPKEPVLERLRASGADDLIAMVEQARFYELPPTPLIAAILELRAAFEMPVILVGNVSHHYGGEWIAQRVGLAAALAQVAAQRPETCYIDPTRIVDRYVMREVMRDLGHYKPECEPMIGAEFVSAIDGFCSGSRLANGLFDRRKTRDANRSKSQADVATAPLLDEEAGAAHAASSPMLPPRDKARPASSRRRFGLSRSKRGGS